MPGKAKGPYRIEMMPSLACGFGGRNNYNQGNYVWSDDGWTKDASKARVFGILADAKTKATQLNRALGANGRHAFNVRVVRCDTGKIAGHSRPGRKYNGVS